MYDVIGSILPLGLAISLSPFPVIAIILVLLSERAKASAASFLIGWVLAISVVTTVMTVIATAIESSDPNASSPLAGVLRIALGIVLLALAARKVRAGAQVDDTGALVLPGWMSTLTTADARRSFTMALLLAGANPKNLIIGAAAALTIGSDGLDTVQRITAIAVFTLIASGSILLPVVAHALFSKQLDGALRRLERWLLANQHTVMALLLLIFGVVIIGNGIASF